MTLKEMDAKYPKVWIVSYAPLTMYHDIEKLFLTEAEARAFYDSIKSRYPREYDCRIYQVHDIWGWSSKQKKSKITLIEEV